MTVGAPIPEGPTGQDEVCLACGAGRQNPELYPGGFCPMCGRPVGSLGPSSVGSGATSMEAGGVDSVVVSRGRDWSMLVSPVVMPALKVAAVLAGVALIVLAVRLGATESDESDDQQAAESGDVQGGEADDAEDDEDAADLAVGTVDDAATNTLDVEPAEVVAGTGPVVGTEVGSFLFVSVPPDLVRIDLDSGAQHWFRLTGEVHVATATHLVVSSEGGLFAVETDSPQSGGRLMHRFDSGFESRPRVDRSYVLDDGRVALTAIRLDGVSAGSISVVVDPASSSAEVEVFDQDQWWMPAPGLISVPGSGVFDTLGPEPRKVFDGEVVAGGARHLVGYRCDDPTSCRRSVIDRATGEVVVAELPATTSTEGFDRLIGDGENLLATWFDLEMGDDSPNPVQVLDLETGEILAEDFLAIGTSGATLGISASPELVISLDASSDSRLLGVVGNGVVGIHDRSSDSSFFIDLKLATRSPLVPSKVFFVDKGQP